MPSRRYTAPLKLSLELTAKAYGELAGLMGCSMRFISLYESCPKQFSPLYIRVFSEFS
jgi:hypothetical protein